MAGWIDNEITSGAGIRVIVNVWKTSGIYHTIGLVSSALFLQDPFQDLLPVPFK